MASAKELAVFGVYFVFHIQVVDAAEDNVGVIAAATVAVLLVLIFFAGLTIFCLCRHGKRSSDKNKKAHSKKKVINMYQHQNNGYGYQPREVHNHHHHYPNGAVKQDRRMPLDPYPNGALKHERRMPLDPVRIQPIPHPYATYHGPPPALREMPQSYGEGAPPIVIPLAHGGTVAMRPDPRPVIQRSNKRRDPAPQGTSNHRSYSKQTGPHQEYVIQPSYDGIPVIRPVIYIDDDTQPDRHRSKSRSKSRERRKSGELPGAAARIVDIPFDDNTEVNEPAVKDTNGRPSQSLSASHTPSKRRSPEMSRASSTTKLINEPRMSMQDDNKDRDSDSDASFSSKAPSFKWAHGEFRAPDPADGDVMFYPASENVQTETHRPSETNPPVYGYTKVIGANNEAYEPEGKSREEVYGYTSVIKSSMRQNADLATSKQESYGETSASRENQGYEIPASLGRTTSQFNDEPIRYETEHGRATSGSYTANIGASMSDRLTSLVEDGDKSRFNHYNIGAMNFADENEENDEPVQMRVRRSQTPPLDIPRDSFYSQSSKQRPSTPPNDIPLITPRESTEIPPLNLQSSVNTPRSFNISNRPPSPAADFPITPKTSVKSPRPPSPPFDIDTNRSEQTTSANRSSLSTSTKRSAPVDPTTGQPGSFQARQRFIEAHLAAQGASQGPPANKSSAVHFNKNTEVFLQSQPNSPRDNIPLPPTPQNVPMVQFTPGVVPPAPPPPPFLK